MWDLGKKSKVVITSSGELRPTKVDVMSLVTTKISQTIMLKYEISHKV